MGYLINLINKKLIYAGQKDDTDYMESDGALALDPIPMEIDYPGDVMSPYDIE